MPRTLTESQSSYLGQESSRPINVVKWEHSGSEELLSCSGDVVFNSEAYSAGGLNISVIRNSHSATITLPATPARIAEVQNGTWRNGTCLIYAIPSDVSRTGNHASTEGVLQIDGIIVSSRYSGNEIAVSVIHKNLDGNYTPRNIADEVCNHIPPPGTLLVWDDENIVLESRR